MFYIESEYQLDQITQTFREENNVGKNLYLFFFSRSNNNTRDENAHNVAEANDHTKNEKKKIETTKNNEETLQKMLKNIVKSHWCKAALDVKYCHTFASNGSCKSFSNLIKMHPQLAEKAMYKHVTNKGIKNKNNTKDIKDAEKHYDYTPFEIG